MWFGTEKGFKVSVCRPCSRIAITQKISLLPLVERPHGLLGLPELAPLLDLQKLGRTSSALFNAGLLWELPHNFKDFMRSHLFFDFHLRLAKHLAKLLVVII